MKKLLKRCLSAFLFVGVVIGTGLLSSCGGSKTSASDSTSTTESTQLVISGASEVLVGGTADLTVQCGGRNVSATFTSSDTSVATVNTNGRVTGVAVGSATITAAAEGYISATHEISVASSTQDITLSFTVEFASGSRHESIQTGYGIYFASSLDWNNPITAEQDGDVWKVSLEDVEFGQTIDYNAYYGTSSNKWSYMNTESQNNIPRSLAIERGVLAYPLVATFFVPQPVDQVTYKISITIGDNEPLNTGISVYVATDTNNWSVTAKATYNEGFYYYTDTNVDIGWETYKILLGDDTGGSYSYSYPATQAGATAEIKDDTTEVTVNATFETQPPAVNPEAEKHSVTFGLLCTDVANSLQVVYDTATNPNGNWKGMTEVATNEYTYTVDLVDGTYYFFFYTYTTENVRMYADTDSTPFSVTVDGADIAVGVRGTFASKVGEIVNNYVPTTPSATYAVTFILKLTEAMPETGSTSNTNVVMGSDWKVMDFDGTDTFTYTENFADNEYWFSFATWGTAESTITVDGSNWFSFTVSGAAMTITVEGSFVTGTGSIVQA